MTRLRAMIHPFILRRLKTGCIKGASGKTGGDLSQSALAGEQKKLYQAHSQQLENVSCRYRQ